MLTKHQKVRGPVTPSQTFSPPPSPPRKSADIKSTACRFPSPPPSPPESPRACRVHLPAPEPMALRGRSASSPAQQAQTAVAPVLQAERWLAQARAFQERGACEAALECARCALEMAESTRQ